MVSVETYPDGSRYVGQFKAGQREGNGAMEFRRRGRRRRDELLAVYRGGWA